MKKIIIKCYIIVLSIALSNCGFKVIDNLDSNNFSIREIKASGDKRINFKIKNNLIIDYSNNPKNTLILTLDTKKNKQVKEKNINNEITKYEISLISSIELTSMEKNTKHKFTVSSNGDYLAADKYSTTIQNEKRLIEDLTNDLSDKIKNRINLIANDL